MNTRTSRHYLLLSLYQVLFLCSLLICGEGLAQELWVTDGPVYSLAQSGNTLYAGGVFQRVGPATGTFAVSDPATGAAQSGWARVTGGIRSIVPDGSGGWYIGGDITQVGSVVRKGIAHILADKTVDPNFAPDSDGTIYTMARNGSVLYVGGEFSFIGGKNRENIAAIDTATGSATSWDPGANGSVRSLVLDSTASVLFAGGEFSGANSFGGQARNRLAAVDLPAGTVNAWNPGATGTVFALGVYPPPDLGPTMSIIVGGSFNGAASLAGAARDFLGAVSAAAPGIIIGWPTAYPDSTVRTVASVIQGGINGVYLGGDFTHIGLTVRNNAALVAAGGALSAVWDPAPDARVESVFVKGAAVYIGGNFSSVTGGATQRGIAAYDVVSGALTAFNPSIGGDVSAFASDGTSLAFGGEFVSTGMVNRQGFAAFDLSTGQATSLNVAIPGLVSAIAPVGDKIYIGGAFGSVGGQVRTSLAAIDSSGAVQAFDGNLLGVAWSLKASGNTLYVCGAFNNILGDVRNNLAAIDTSTGTLTSWNPNPDNQCKSLAIDSSGTIYAGGYFSTFAGPVTRTFLAAIDAAGSVTSWDPAPNGVVETVLTEGDYIYAGGTFTGIGGKPRRFLAQFNRSNGAVTTWDPQPSSMPNTLVAFNGRIIAGGYFTAIGQALRYGIAALDPVTGFADEWNPMLMSPLVQTISASSNRVIAGGFFNSTNFAPLAFLANVTPMINTASPAAPSGTAKDGETLSVVNDGTWSGFGTITTSARQWQRCTASGAGCYDIAGQTGASYVLGAADAGNTVRIYVTAEDSLMSVEAGGTPSAIVAPKNSVLPKIKGKAKVGNTLSVTAGNWNGVSELTISYQWQRCGSICKNISKGKTNKYKVGAKDVGKKLLVVVKASKNGSSKTTANSKKTKKVKTR